MGVPLRHPLSCVASAWPAGGSTARSKETTDSPGDACSARRRLPSAGLSREQAPSPRGCPRENTARRGPSSAWAPPLALPGGASWRRLLGLGESGLGVGGPVLSPHPRGDPPGEEPPTWLPGGHLTAAIPVPFGSGSKWPVCEPLLRNKSPQRFVEKMRFTARDPWGRPPRPDRAAPTSSTGPRGAALGRWAGRSDRRPTTGPWRGRVHRRLPGKTDSPSGGAGEDQTPSPCERFPVDGRTRAP